MCATEDPPRPPRASPLAVAPRVGRAHAYAPSDPLHAPPPQMGKAAGVLTGANVGLLTLWNAACGAYCAYKLL